MSARKFEALTQFVEETMTQTAVPGFALGVLHNGEVKTAAFGVTNVDHPLPVTSNTFFQIGSITKTFTATLIMRLIALGKLQLDEPIAKHLPSFRVADEQISTQATIRHLLTHTGGWVGDHFIATSSSDAALQEYVATMHTLPQLAPLGQLWSYNNAGFAVAGHLIERLMSQPYPVALTEQLLRPLGMSLSTLDPLTIMTKRFAVGHHTAEGKTAVATPYALPTSISSMGGLHSTTSELLRYAQFHMGDGRLNGESFLLPQQLKMMQAQQVSIGGSRMGCGISWLLNEAEGIQTVGHGGGTVGQQSLLTMVPSHQLAYVMFSNSNEGSQLYSAVQDWILAKYVGVKTAVYTPIEQPNSILETCCGIYERPYQTIEIYREENNLLANIAPKQGFPTQEMPPAPPTNRLALYHYAPDYVYAPIGIGRAFGEFVTHDGEMWLRFNGRLHKKVT